MTSHHFGQKSTHSSPCHISSQVYKPPSNITSQFAKHPPYICNYKFPSILCLPRQKFHLCFIDLICARCGKTNILFVKRRKYCTHR